MQRDLGFAVNLPSVDPTSNAATLHYTMGVWHVGTPANDNTADNMHPVRHVR